MLKIWGRNNSSNVQKVLWCCEELSVAYERYDVGGPFGGTDTPEYKAMNPNSRVPTIEDDGFILWESHAIVRYIARTRGAEAMLSSDPRKLAIQEKWMDWFGQHAWQAFLPGFQQLVRTPEPERKPEIIARAQEQVSEALAIAEEALGDNAFFTGDNLTVADLPMGILAYRWFNMDWPTPRAPTPRYEAFYNRLTERPAFKKVCMLPLT